MRPSRTCSRLTRRRTELARSAARASCEPRRRIVTSAGISPRNSTPAACTLILDRHRQGHFGTLLADDSHPQPKRHSEGKGFGTEAIGQPVPEVLEATSHRLLWGRALQFLTEAEEGSLKSVSFSLTRVQRCRVPQKPAGSSVAPFRDPQGGAVASTIGGRETNGSRHGENRPPDRCAECVAPQRHHAGRWWLEQCTQDFPDSPARQPAPRRAIELERITLRQHDQRANMLSGQVEDRVGELRQGFPSVLRRPRMSSRRLKRSRI